MDAAAIVLAGGRSSRMGSPKASLEWHRSTMLHRICGVCTRAVDGPVIVVVSASDQELPRLPSGVKVVYDEHRDRGPLEGLATGLAAAAAYAPVAYATATDVPLLHPVFIDVVRAAMREEDDVVLPEVDGFPQPLAAAYKTALAPVAAELAASGRVRFRFLFNQCRVRRLRSADLLADERLAAHDPELDSVLSIDTMEEYSDVRSRPAPPVTIERTGTLVRDVDQGPRPIRAAILDAAATAAGLDLATGIRVAIDGRPIIADPELPLIAGDRITFAPAAP